VEIEFDMKGVSMKDLTISQKYLLCVLNEKGKLPALDTGIEVCILAGGLYDLIFSESVRIGEDKRICFNGELDSNLNHLESLHKFIKESKSMKIDKLASEYSFTLSDKRKKQLINDIGNSLVDLGLATHEKGGLFANTDYYIPKKEYIDRIIESIRAELLEEGNVSDDMIVLVSLLEKSKVIKRYFSAYEKDRLKIRINEIKETDAHKVVKEMVDYIDGLIAVFAAIGVIT